MITLVTSQCRKFSFLNDTQLNLRFSLSNMQRNISVITFVGYKYNRGQSIDVLHFIPRFIAVYSDIAT